MQGQILHLPQWALTALGTSVDLFRKGHTAASAKPLIFIGGVHGDEPEGVRLAQDLLAWLQSDDGARVKRPWILIPNLNPDGFAKAERVNGRGVDLNRNFPSSDWTPEVKAPRYNPGLSPGSEPEVRALCDLLRKENPEIIVHFHSWKPCVVYSGAAGKPYAELIAAPTGYEAREDIGYPTPGSLGQYGLLNLKIPVICVEAQEGDPLDTLWSKFGPGLRAVLLGEGQ